jgi:tetratricopeptide (TPR) repeat protein
VPKFPSTLKVGFVLALGLCLLPATGSFGGENEKRAKQEMNIGFKAARRGYWLEAIHRFEQANRLTPNQPRILNNMAVAMEASGRFEEALVTYEAAMALDPSNRALRQNYSRFKEFYDALIAPPPPPEEAKDEQAAEENNDKEEPADDQKSP